MHRDGVNANLGRGGRGGIVRVGDQHDVGERVPNSKDASLSESIDLRVVETSPSV